MDYKKDCEEKLRKYVKTEETLKLLHERLEKISMQGKPADISAIDFSKTGHSSMFSDAMQDLVEAKHILNQIHKVESEKEIVDKVLNLIKRDNKEDYDFIELRYFKNKSLEETISMLGYSNKSNKTVYKIKDRALNNFCMYYWGK